MDGCYWSVQECRWVRSPRTGDPLATPWSEAGVPVPDRSATSGLPSLAPGRVRVPAQRPRPQEAPQEAPAWPT